MFDWLTLKLNLSQECKLRRRCTFRVRSTVSQFAAAAALEEEVEEQSGGESTTEWIKL